jgi:hypothetical protein
VLIWVTMSPAFSPSVSSRVGFKAMRAGAPSLPTSGSADDPLSSICT